VGWGCGDDEKEEKEKKEKEEKEKEEVVKDFKKHF
jgi:hypothetical protein